MLVSNDRKDFGNSFLFKEVGNTWSPGRDLGLRAYNSMTIALNFLNRTHREPPLFLSFPGIALIIVLLSLSLLVAK